MIWPNIKSSFFFFQYKHEDLKYKVYSNTYISPSSPLYKTHYYQTQFHSGYAKRSGVIQQGIDTIVKLNKDFNEEARAKNGTMPYLVFKIKIDLDADIKQFHVDRVKLENCDVKFLGLSLFSYCGLVEKAIKESAEKFARKFNVFTMPKLLDRIENLLRYKIGEDIYIPLLVADEKSLALARLIEKADEVTKLKADIASDVASVTKDVADFSKTLNFN